MKVAGFCFIRNAVQYDYPIVEAVLSILPLCDEFVIAAGKSDDGTLELIQSINHYGWVKHPSKMQKKINSFVQLYRENAENNIAKADEFDYSNIDALSRFNGTHPEVMRNHIERMNWQFDYDISKRNLPFKYKIY
jgi:hypothetical protein